MSRFYELHENCSECPALSSDDYDGNDNNYFCCITGSKLTVKQYSDQIGIEGKCFPKDCKLKELNCNKSIELLKEGYKFNKNNLLCLWWYQIDDIIDCKECSDADKIKSIRLFLDEEKLKQKTKGRK